MLLACTNLPIMLSILYRSRAIVASKSLDHKSKGDNEVVVLESRESWSIVERESSEATPIPRGEFAPLLPAKKSCSVEAVDHTNSNFFEK